jgi:hypothetical protein
LQAFLCPADHYCVNFTLTLPWKMKEFASVADLLRSQQRVIGCAASETALRLQIATDLQEVLQCKWFPFFALFR